MQDKTELQKEEERLAALAAELAEQAKAERFLVEQDNDRKLAAEDQAKDNTPFQQGLDSQNISLLNEPADNLGAEEPQKQLGAEPDPVPERKVDHKLMEDMYPHGDAMAELLRRKHPEMYNDWEHER